MKTATISDFRQNMNERLDQIKKDQDALKLTSSKKKTFVVLTLEMYNAMKETAHLSSTPANFNRLMESIAQDLAGQATTRRLRLSQPTKSSKRRSSTSTKKSILKTSSR